MTSRLGKRKSATFFTVHTECNFIMMFFFISEATGLIFCMVPPAWLQSIQSATAGGGGVGSDCYSPTARLQNGHISEVQSGHNSAVQSGHISAVHNGNIGAVSPPSAGVADTDISENDEEEEDGPRDLSPRSQDREHKTEDSPRNVANDSGSPRRSRSPKNSCRSPSNSRDECRSPHNNTGGSLQCQTSLEANRTGGFNFALHYVRVQKKQSNLRYVQCTLYVYAICNVLYSTYERRMYRAVYGIYIYRFSHPVIPDHTVQYLIVSIFSYF